MRADPILRSYDGTMLTPLRLVAGRQLRGWAIVVLFSAIACGRHSTRFDLPKQPARRLGDPTAKLVIGDAHWANRHERAEVEAALGAWTEAAEVDPTRADIQIKLAYGHYLLANAYLKWDEDDDAVLASLDRGIAAGERAVKLACPNFAAKIRNGERWSDAIPVVRSEGLPAMYWYATNLGMWGIIDGLASTLSLRDRVTAIINHCRRLDEGFFYGAPHRYLGVLMTFVPFPGGDLPAAKRHFERSLKIAPGYLGTRILYAEYYATKSSDKALYVKLLNEVLASPDDVIPELAPENRLAKRAATTMLAKVDEYF